MRLSADATLIVIGLRIPPPLLARFAPRARTSPAHHSVAESLPLVRVCRDTLASGAPPRFMASATPVEEEPIIGEAEALENLLDGTGVTTLVMCGALSAL